MTDTATTTPTTKVTTKRPPRKAAPGKTVEELLAGFSPAGAAALDPAQAARDELTANIKEATATYASSIAGLVGASTDTEAVKGFLVSLSTAEARAVKSVKTIPAEALGVVAAA